MKTPKFEPPTWQYRGVTIGVRDNGMFYTFNPRTGREINSSSLDSMKKRLGKVLGFETFRVITPRQGSMLCIGASEREGFKLQALDSGYETTVRRVIVHTKDNAVAFKAYESLRKAHESTIEKLRQELTDAYEALPWKSPEDYL